MNGIAAFVIANAAGAAGLSIVAVLAGRVVRRPEFAHAMWLMVLLKLVAPPLLIVPLLPALTGPPVRPVQPPLESVELQSRAPTIPEPYSPPEELLLPSAIEPAPVSPQNWSPSWRECVAAVWAAGAVGYWLSVIVGTVRFARTLRTATPADSTAMQLVENVARRMGLRRLPSMVFLDAAVSPLVWAPLGRPRVVLPTQLWQQLTDGQREAILAHELAHLVRRDHWVRRLEVLIVGCYWWFPVAWFARSRLRRAEEACCDARVVRAYPALAQSYAETLIEVVAFVGRPRRVAFASGGLASARELERRVIMILSTNPASAPGRIAPALLLAGVLAILMLRPGFAQDAPPAVPPPPTAPAADPAVPPTPPAAPPGLPAPSAGQPPLVGMSAPANASAPSLRVSKETFQQLKDEVEVLESHRETKVAQLQVAKFAVQAAERTLAIHRRNPGSSVVPLAGLEDEVNLAKGKLAVQEAELREHEVKIKQVRRRLDAAVYSPVDSAQRELDGIREAIRQNAQFMVQSQKRIEVVRAQLEQLKGSYEDLKKQQVDLEQRLKAKEAQLQQQSAEPSKSSR